MAELKLTKIIDRKDRYYLKKYEYGQFKMTVDIDIYDEKKFSIQAEDENKASEIIMITGDKEAHMSLPLACLDLNNADEFLKMVQEGIELLKLIKEQKEELIKKEIK